MIADNIKNHQRYIKTNENIEIALSYLYDVLNKDVFEEGIFEINDEVKAVHIEGDLKETNKIKYEIHEKYMDIHAVYDGIECFGYLLDNENYDYEYDVDKDIAFIDVDAIETEEVITLRKNSFCAVWPFEFHKPLILRTGETTKTVKKIIMKVKL
jgi:YhcH/YjgK/YiaL family protein